MSFVRLWFPYFLLIVGVTPILLSKLVGIKLCQDECFHAGGCKDFIFDNVHLRCELKDDSNDRKTNRSGEVFNKKQKVCGPTSCHVGERCIMKRQGGRACICVQTKELNRQELTSADSSVGNRTASFMAPCPNNSKHNKSPMTVLNAGRRNSLRQHLLVIPKNSRSKTHSYKVNTETFYDKISTTFLLKHVLAVVYLDQLQQLLVSTSIPGKIQFSDLTGNETAVLKCGVYAFAMTHDEGRQLVFFLEPGAQVKVMKVSIRTKQSKFLKKGYGISALVADTSRHVLYTTDHAIIMLFSYEGQFLNEVRKNGVDNLLFAKNFLYYSVGCSIYKKLRHRTFESFVTKLKVIPLNFEFNGHTLFASASNAEELLAIDVSNPLIVRTIPLPSAFANDTVLCVIP